MRGLGVGIVLALASTGCFAPAAPGRCAITCSTAVGAAPCPSGMTCEGDFCLASGELPCGDASVVVTDAPPLGDAGLALGGDTCELAVKLDVPGQYRGTTTGFPGQYGGTQPGCTGTALPENDVVYEIDIPAGLRLLVAIEADLHDSALMLVDGTQCLGEPSGCLAADDSSPRGGVDALSHVNTTDAPLPTYLIVDGYTKAPPNDGPFTLHLDLVPGTLGEKCANPVRLPPASGMVTRQTTVGYANDVPSVPCLGFPVEGGDRFFQLQVPAGAVWSVRAHPTLEMDVALYAVAAMDGACTFSSCLGADVEPAGVLEELALDGGPGGTTFVIGVDSAPVEGSFDLEVVTP